MTLLISNLPNDKSRTKIRDSFLPFCRHYNCRFRFDGRDSAKLVFNNVNDAKRAELRLNELEFFGRELFVESDTTYDKQDFYSSDVSSTTGSLYSVPLGPDSGVVPANDDKCKSVIIGLYTKYNRNINKLVRKNETV